jgi:hypothetical protein
MNEMYVHKEEVDIFSHDGSTGVNATRRHIHSTNAINKDRHIMCVCSEFTRYSQYLRPCACAQA